MRNRLSIGALSVAVIGLILGVVYYLNLPGPLPPPIALATSEPVKPAEIQPAKDAAQGVMETVTTPPKTFGGQLSPDATSMEEFSSNPKRDPAEQGVLDLAAERGVSDQVKVQRLLAMIPNLPPDAQTLAMENATALIPDTNYLTYRGQLLQLAKSPEMRETVMNDSLTRGEDLRLPNLLEMLRTSTDEAEKKEIREIFEAYLDKDYGPQPSQWEAPLRKWVAENADK
ncbi:MAG: hypothetical protein JWL90_3569 [Chthoniobacteraceae bacterium]|nr:hypothetical protein [Chthoniobacteraceae bacterium]